MKDNCCCSAYRTLWTLTHPRKYFPFNNLNEFGLGSKSQIIFYLLGIKLSTLVLLKPDGTVP